MKRNWIFKYYLNGSHVSKASSQANTYWGRSLQSYGQFCSYPEGTSFDSTLAHRLSDYGRTICLPYFELKTSLVV
jgi:hypothetical protein